MTAGRSGRRWVKAKAAVYERRAPCCRCKQPIDYNRPYLDPMTRSPDPQAKSVDHYPIPLSVVLKTAPHLAEDLSNLAAAHLGCNLAAGARGVDAGAAQTSREW